MWVGWGGVGVRVLHCILPLSRKLELEQTHRRARREVCTGCEGLDVGRMGRGGWMGAALHITPVPQTSVGTNCHRRARREVCTGWGWMWVGWGGVGVRVLHCILPLSRKLELEQTHRRARREVCTGCEGLDVGRMGRGGWMGAALHITPVPQTSVGTNCHRRARREVCTGWGWMWVGWGGVGVRVLHCILPLSRKLELEQTHRRARREVCTGCEGWVDGCCTACYVPGGVG